MGDVMIDPPEGVILIDSHSGGSAAKHDARTTRVPRQSSREWEAATVGEELEKRVANEVNAEMKTEAEVSLFCQAPVSVLLPLMNFKTITVPVDTLSLDSRCVPD